MSSRAPQVDLRGQFPQGQLPQLLQVLLAEKVCQRRLDPIGGIDLSFLQALAEVLGGQIDIHDLIRLGKDGIGDPLVHLDPGGTLDDVIEALEVLDVQGADHVDPLGQDVLHILVSLLVAAPGDVCVRQFIDKDDLGLAGQDGIEVHLLDDDPAVFLPSPGDDLQPLQEPGDAFTAVGLHEPDHHVDSFIPEPVRFLEHLPGLAHAGGIAQVDLQPPPLGPPDQSQERIGTILNVHTLRAPIEIQVQHQDVHPGLAEDAQGAPFRMGLDFTDHGLLAESARSRNPGRLQKGIFRADVGIEAAAGSAHGVGRDPDTGGKIIFGPVVTDTLRRVVYQLFGEGAQVASPRTGGVVAGTCSRRARMKVLRAGKPLGQQTRPHRLAALDNQRPVGLPGEDPWARPQMTIG